MKFRVVTGAPVPEVIGDACEEISRRSGASITSGFRGDPAESLLRRLGKSTQAMLYNGWVRRLPGYNPANPPKQSTHECYSDGVPYPGPVGRPLAGWQCGTDWSNSDAAIGGAKEIGLVMFRPYADGREYHHLNFAKQPKWRKVRPLSKGARGRRVGQLTGWLAYLGYDVEKTGRFDQRVHAAVVKFQSRHKHLADDGVAGPHTLAQLKAGVRGKKNCRKQAMRIKDKPHRKAALAACDRKYAPTNEG